MDTSWQLQAPGWSKVNDDGNCERVLGHAMGGLNNSKRLVSMPILFHIRDLVHQLKDVEFKLIRRCNNKMADRISRFVCSSNFNVYVLEYLTDDLQDLLLADVGLFGSG
ncbi:hypothetical protein V6N13_090578 [Hibiscus sabdariffa]|uniref:RNase H type-1 domain-containing protein n=1 Tax=Hibiscus sabdariffa TaxID=183260 RepID=A0ABR2NXI4_9ROSI